MYLELLLAVALFPSFVQKASFTQSHNKQQQHLTVLFVLDQQLTVLLVGRSVNQSINQSINQLLLGMMTTGDAVPSRHQGVSGC